MIEIQSPALLVTVLPEVGGKVAQIRDKHSGHDLLIPPQRPYRTIPIDGDWLQHDTSGMDDCFPNVAAGPYPQQPWTATHLPDLGEWTHGVWAIATGVNPGGVVMERGGSVLPYFARKTIRFAGDRILEFSYYLENRGDAPIRYLWSAHPLIAVPENYQLELPPGDLKYRVFPSRGEAHTWPLFEDVELSHEWITRGANLKVFVTGLSEGWCTLRLPAHSLNFRFDLEFAPVLGLWFNHYGFPGQGELPFRCIAIEPCTSPSDLLDDLEPSAYPILAPGQSVEWSLQLEIQPHSSAQAEQHQ